jgi:hypothetical protein
VATKNGKLIVSEGGRERVHELLDDVTVVGRGDRADLRLRDPKAAPLHFEIRRTPQGFKLVDLETRDGTAVNGSTVNTHFLMKGDTVRIGAAEITYLGDSADDAPPPKSPAPLREIPVGDDGEPKRFYRHEATVKRGSSAAVTWGILGVVVIVGIFIAMAIVKEVDASGERASFREAQVLIASANSEEAVRRAVRILDGIQPGKIDPRDMARARQDARVAIEGFKAYRRGEEETAAWTKIVDVANNRPEQTQELIALIDSFLTEFPDSSNAEKAKARRKSAQLGGDPEVYWKGFIRDVTSFSKAGRWADAFGAFAKLEQNAPMRKELGSRVDSNRRILEDEFSKYVATKFEDARAAVAGGDAPRALRIYAEIQAVGVAPHADAARLAAEALR